MRLFEKIGFIVLASGLALGQGTAQSSGSNSSGSVSDELKALREAISEQQKQISQQQQQIQTLQQQLQDKAQAKQQPAATVSPRITEGTARVQDASLHTTPVAATTVVQETERPKESPLSFRIGNTDFTPGGFVDFENVFRTTNTGASITTPFGTIPFRNAATGAGQLTEFRSTGQYSRYNLKISGKYGENKLVGYIEGDFNGNDATNVFVTSNPHTNRLRLYWLDLRRGNWEFLGGQTWGLQTPNRVGLSPNPADVFTTIGEDAQTHVGLPYTRAAEFRATYHFSDHFQWAVALQNPDQFAINVAFPSAFATPLGAQLDQGAITSAPDAFPDIHTKMAWDTDAGGKHMHFEAGGLITSVRTAAQDITAGTASGNFIKHTSVGGGVEAAFNFELFKGFRILANGIGGDGIGRYLIGLAPDTVVVPIATGVNSFTLDNSLVHSGSGILGIETSAKKSQFGFYYGGIYAQRNAFPDVTATAAVKPIIGYGGIGSPNTNNRAIQEGTVDWTQTFWKNPQYGAVLLVTQASYLTRAPWFVATTPTPQPKNAHLVMGYISLKYVLP
jgi:hypothetical protein